MPPYFTNGIRRRVSSSSSRPVSCEVRLRTAWSRSVHSLLARLHHPVADLGGLRGFVAAEDRARGPLPSARSVRSRLGNARLAWAASALASVEDRLGGAVVALERHDVGLGEVARELQDVLGASGAQAVDRLKVVADHRDLAPTAAQRPDDLDLQPVDVLVLVDQEVIEGVLDRRPRDLVDDERSPVEQQIVEVEHTERPLPLAVGFEQRAKRLDVLLAPREALRHHSAQRLLSVDRARVDVQRRALLGKPALGLSVTVLLAD